MTNANQAPQSERVHIAIFGKTNAGKSTLMNALCNQEIAVVSPYNGTTTDPVYKSMELLPIGPVVLIDTAGLDDTTELGKLRVDKSLAVIGKTDFAMFVISNEDTILDTHKQMIHNIKKTVKNTICIVNTIAEKPYNHESVANFLEVPTIAANVSNRDDIEKIKQFMITQYEQAQEISITADLVQQGDVVLLVAPQDKQAPKGRLILPQVQTIRDLLDNRCKVVVVVLEDLADMLSILKHPPALVITDSQIFAKVNKIVPNEIPLTSFSVLMAKYKGDVTLFLEGAKAIDTLKATDKVLIMESCTHHQIEGDIAREKLPKLLQKKVGQGLQIEFFAGKGFPNNIEEYALIIHCGGCMINRKNMLTKQSMAKELGVPITNFGIAIAYMNELFERITY